MKVIYKKNTDTATNMEVRRCVNCGTDISKKRKGTRFCSQACYQAYHNMHKVIGE